VAKRGSNSVGCSSNAARLVATEAREPLAVVGVQVHRGVERKALEASNLAPYLR
jgi:hypothetical protein